MLVECTKCGGPLDAQPGDRMRKCNYCGTASAVATMRTIAAVTPPGWAPPPVWTPPPGMVVGTPQLAYRAASAAAGITIVTAIVPIVLTCVIGGAVAASMFFAFRAVPSMPSPSATTVSIPRSWNGGGPFMCGGSENVTFTGVQANLAGQTAVIASGSCQLTLVSCDITAAHGVLASGNARVVIRGGSVTGSPVALAASGNGQIDVQGARIVGATTARVPGQITGVP